MPTVVCPTHGLRYDPAESPGCIRCPRAPSPAPPSRARAIALAVTLALLVTTALVARHYPLPPPLSFLYVSPAPAVAAGPSPQRLHTANSIGRTGTYYVPASAPRGAPIPLLVFLHGTGGSGSGGIRDLRALADERGFAVLAPDSGKSPDGQFNWQVGDAPGDYTPDRAHVMACLAELLAIEHLTLDPQHVLVAGHSGGASSAPYLATNEAPFTAFAVLHGGAFPKGFGQRRVRGWFSTGDADPLRPPSMVARAYDASHDPASSYEMHVFAGGHELGEEERRALVAWWLGDAGPAKP